ncbi:MAG: type II toxin-antitoxin system RelE/ParE family toxin [Prosthecobacter sp.]|nr:type II toxin-antitoxin system RelE/ParE family toxin [Prosthecobacter sp.]
MRQLRILDEAFEDTAAAAEWYDHCGGKELGDRFLRVFYSYLPEILKDAEIHRPVYRQFRRILIKPFPYAVYFRIQQDWVIVTLVWHTARNPVVLKELLEGRIQ